MALAVSPTPADQNPECCTVPAPRTATPTSYARPTCRAGDPRLPLWLVTMPTRLGSSGVGTQTFAVRAATVPAAIATATARALSHQAVQHRRGAKIDPLGARAVPFH
ncbi:hypothetical protein ACFW1A_06680 [Kitasatospora sp. NPDC058965]|uniref:hypothetical protein n=1 Tax=Kitasatospora sp. NPDC058965 TaxID=3346682 RepID=UPI0036B21E83